VAGGCVHANTERSDQCGFVGLFLKPVIRLLIRRTRLSRPWAVGIVYAFFILVLFAIPSALGTVAVRQYYRFEAEFLIALTALEQWISQRHHPRSE